MAIFPFFFPEHDCNPILSHDTAGSSTLSTLTTTTSAHHAKHLMKHSREKICKLYIYIYSILLNSQLLAKVYKEEMCIIASDGL